ncbi:MAG: tetratricopeptide repeat protein [Spirochaetes bacterium]|nr:tetratricopeptide repeat protein [Spirochaetota bacterium]
MEEMDKDRMAQYKVSKCAFSTAAGKKRRAPRLFLAGLLALFMAAGFGLGFGSCQSSAATAEEYFSLGMAFFDLGNFEEAERWLNRARSADRTMVASEYNLGRIAFERNRFQEAAGHFEGILRRDPDNVLALQAAAFTRIMTGDLDLAEAHYDRVLTLIPDSADNGFNHALVLFAMGRYSQAEEVLARFPFALLENGDTQLLFARVQAAQDNIEAINSFETWLSENDDPRVRYEYARVLENHAFFARALEEYRLALSDFVFHPDIRRGDIRFGVARVLLVADSDSQQGIVELETAIEEGFDNIEAVQALAGNMAISANNRDRLRMIAGEMQRGVQQGVPPAIEALPAEEFDPAHFDAAQFDAAQFYELPNW